MSVCTFPFHRRRLVWPALWSALTCVALLVVMSPPPASAAPASAPVGEFVVRGRDSTSSGELAGDHERRLGVHPRYVYRRALVGYAANLTAGQRRALSRDRRVASLTPSREVHVSVDWGLDRLDQRALPLDGHFSPDGDGAGVTIDVIDTGVRRTHDELRGRVAPGVNLIDGGTPDDCNGHGTHVAGIAAGRTTGVATAATIVPVRAVDCSGGTTTAAVIAAIDWVVEHHVPGQPEVANMSLGGPPSDALDAAVVRAMASGIAFVVAAGNGDARGRGVNACGNSPARVPAAITVGASSSADAKAPFSNYGRCVDLFAPGVDIASAWPTSDHDHRALSGTSMAAPFVTGIAALYLARHPATSPVGLARALEVRAAPDAVSVPGRKSAPLAQAVGLD